jgi:predicted TIM-barrel fold metal-dependent hydrolase
VRVIIDAHTHVFAESQVAGRARLCGSDATFGELYTDPKAKLATAEMLLSELETGGIDAAVVAGFAFSDAAQVAGQNRAILGSARQHPQLIPLATVNPALPRWRGEAERALADGARGFGELRPHNQGWDPLGPDGRALCEMAREADAVLLWHVSEPVGHSYPGKAGGISATELCVLAETFPELRMIAAHLGAGLSFFLYMPEMRTTLRNVFFDTAAWRFLYDDGSIAQLVAQAGASRVLFGSDYPLLSPQGELQRLRAVLSGVVASSVCGAAAETLFSEPRLNE